MAAPSFLLIGSSVHNCDTDDFVAGSLNNEIFVEGTGSIGQKISGSINELITSTIPATLDFSASGANEDDHIIMWFDGLNANDSDEFNIYVGESDSDFGWWRVGPPTDYTGGFLPYVIDPHQEFDVGAGSGLWTDSDNPSQLNAVTIIGGRFDITGTIAGNYHNCIIDKITVGTGVRIGDGDSDDPGTFSSVQNYDEGTNQYGFWTSVIGAFVARGALRIGPDTDSDASCYFEDANQVVAFKDAPVRQYYYAISIHEPGTGTTTVSWDGIFIYAENPASARWSLDIDSDDTSQISISNCTFSGTDFINLLDSDTSITATKFDDATNIYHIGASITGSSFINANTDSDESLIYTSKPQLITYCDFVADIGGHALELDANTDTDFAFTGNTFTGYGADGSESAAIYNNSGKAITINLSDTASTPTVRNGGGASTTVLNTVPLTIQVVDENGSNVENARCSIYLDSDDTELMNELSLASGQATETYNYLADVDIYWRVRKHSPAANRYVLAKGTGTIEDTGFSLTVTLRLDPVT